jgi:hypothetical protein
MQINSRSLHYRFNSLVQSDKFTDRALCGRFTTCSYIRTCLYSLLKGAFNSVVGLLLAIIVSWILGSALIVPVLIFFFDSHPIDLFIVPTVAVWGCVVVGLAVLFIKQVKERLKKSFKPSTTRSVFVQAIVDKHNKFCTRVEVV